MPAIATVNSVTTGHGSFPPAKADQDVPWFTVNGVPVILHGDKFLPHSDGDSTHIGAAVSTRPWLSVGGRGVVCVGDPLTCGDHIATGDGSLNVS